MIKGAKAQEVIAHLLLLFGNKRLKVKEVTLNLPSGIMLIARKCFPYVTQVSDRFHVQQLMNEAVNDLRVSYCWQAIDLENTEIELSKETGRKYVSHTFGNEGTRRQLLVRCRYVVMKHPSKWTESQRIRAEILFEECPLRIDETYKVFLELEIYNRPIGKKVAMAKMAQWYDKVERLDLKFFKSVPRRR